MLELLPMVFFALKCFGMNSSEWQSEEELGCQVSVHACPSEL